MLLEFITTYLCLTTIINVVYVVKMSPLCCYTFTFHTLCVNSVLIVSATNVDKKIKGIHNDTHIHIICFFHPR